VATEGAYFWSLQARKRLRASRRIYYFDTFPELIDPVEEAQLNVRTVRRLWRRSEALDAGGIGEAMESRDVLASVKLQMESYSSTDR